MTTRMIPMFSDTSTKLLRRIQGNDPSITDLDVMMQRPSLSIYHDLFNALSSNTVVKNLTFCSFSPSIESIAMIPVLSKSAIKYLCVNLHEGWENDKMELALCDAIGELVIDHVRVYWDCEFSGGFPTGTFQRYLEKCRQKLVSIRAPIRSSYTPRVGKPEALLQNIYLQTVILNGYPLRVTDLIEKRNTELARWIYRYDANGVKTLKDVENVLTDVIIECLEEQQIVVQTDVVSLVMSFML